MSNNKYLIKIPDNITVLYCKKKNIITIIGTLTKKSLKLKVRLFILEKMIQVTPFPSTKISNKQKKNIFAIQGLTAAELKQLLLETTYIYYKKLKLIGIGYRIFDVEELKNQIMLFKLGFSHPIYLKPMSQINFFCINRVTLFLFSNDYKKILQTAAFIKSHKRPDPYKGKGILYETDTIILKEGKKV